MVENGYIYKLILAQFITFCWIIYLFIMLHKKNPYILCTNCLRMWYVYN